MTALVPALGFFLFAANATTARGVVQFAEQFVRARFQISKQPLKIVIPSEAEGRFSSGHGFSRAVRRSEETGFSR